MDQNISNFVNKFKTLYLHSANINTKSQIVLNDLRLLELVHTYPFLFSKSVLPQNDKDYEEWGWETITKEFNSSYKGLILRKPFTVEELRGRWAVLQPLCRSFNPNLCRLPKPLSRIIEKIRQLMLIRPTTIVPTFKPTSLFILNQLPLVEHLSKDQQRQLEVEVLDAIFREERISQSVSQKLNEKDKQAVQRECKEFLKSMRIKDMLGNVRSPSSAIGSKSPDRLPASGNNKRGGDVVINNEPEPIHHPVQPPIMKAEPPDQQLQNEHPQQQEMQEAQQQQETQEEQQQHQQQQQQQQQQLPHDEQEKPPNDQRLEQPLYHDEQEEKPLPEELQQLQKLTAAPSQVSASQPINSPVQYVPLKSAKYYVKNVKVRIKRLKLKEILPRPTKRKSGRRRY